MDKEARRRRWLPVWRPRVLLRQTTAGRSRFGDVVIVLFLLAQAADGVMTYVGIATFGVTMEANPLLASLMAMFGHGATIAAAKVTASVLGISLHLLGVHRVLAVLTFIYAIAALLPWVTTLLIA
jgi:hypothetical protein